VFLLAKYPDSDDSGASMSASLIRKPLDSSKVSPSITLVTVPILSITAVRGALEGDEEEEPYDELDVDEDPAALPVVSGCSSI